ncbi:DUF551 domain-containing protein [Escherichia coli]|nr:DUF551 domain-containing protein [Escherichia coli]EFJ2417826.1 DUF551 domain-containing protein [Escherichia coli]EHP3456853.1 DUF551 domain-containing protein [Escherichia coli]EIJ1370448.1 DUF551 domain-containing protein [Escherichia coli]EIT7407845.1 DUF551 domain-containing protein [Escherichia coli]
MITITKERLLTIKQWRETYGPGSNVVLPAEEAEELARIALASLEADPVAYIFKHPAGKLFWALTDESNKEQADVIPVYAAAPASVVPDNASEPLAYAYKELTPEIMRNHLAVFERYGIAPNDSSTTIQALRIALDGIERSDAMLHGAEPASNHEELPLDYLQGQKDGLEWAAQLAEANHPQTGDWLYDDPLELAKAIRKGPDMPEFDGPTPVTPEAIENAIEYIRSIAFHIDEDDYHGKHIAYFMRQALVWLEGHSCSDDRQGKAENQPVRGNQAAESNRGNEWTGNPDIDNAIIMLDRIDTLENCDDDRIEAVKAVLRRLAGNYPVTPDGWISCSDLMPEDTKMLLAFSQGEIVAAYWNWVVNPIDYKKYRAFTYLSGNILDDVTHWMPLPEPPQEVK